MIAPRHYCSSQAPVAAARFAFIALLSATVMFPLAVFATELEADQHGTLIVTLSGMKSDEGSLVYAMWSGPEGWLEDNNIREGSVPIENGSSTLHFPDLPYGEYAISVYHDLNGNGKLDTGMFRIPKEPLGTSNDAKIRFGPPKYEDAVFVLDQPELKTHIPVRKLFGR